MGHCLHQTKIHLKSAFDQVFPIACNGAGYDGKAGRSLGVNLLQLFFDGGDGVAQIVLIVFIQYILVFVQQHHFGGGTACVYSQIRLARIFCQIAIAHVRLLVAL